MQRIAILFLLLTALLFGQNKYFLPIKIEQSNGRPINAANVDLYTAGTSTKVYDLTYLSNSAGAYYYTSAITTGFYDIYVNGRSWKTYVYINSSNQNTSTIALTTIEANDTTELKAMTAYGDTATFRYLAKRVSTDPATKVKLIGGGFFVQGDSTEMMAKFGTATADAGAIFANAGTAKRWYRASLDYSKDIPVTWYGGNHTALNSAITLASTLKGRVIIEDTVAVGDTVLLKSNTRLIGEGERNLIQRASGYGGRLFDITGNVTDVYMENLNLSNLDSVATFWTEGATDNYVTGLTIKGCKFSNYVGGNSGIIDLGKEGNSEVRLIDNDFVASDSISTVVIDGITNGWFIGNRFFGTTLKIEGSVRNVWLQHCQFDSVDQSNFLIRAGASDTLRNIHIDYNIFNDCSYVQTAKGAGGVGGEGGASSHAEFITITGNLVNGHYGNGITVGSANTSMYGVEISNNVIKGSKAVNSDHYAKATWGINLINGSGQIKIMNNTIEGEGHAGIVSAGDSVFISGNRITNTGLDTTTTDHRVTSGIYISSGSKNVVVSNNFVENTGNSKTDGAADEKACGIVVARSTGTDNIAIMNNRITDTRATKYTKYGIHVDVVAVQNTELPTDLQIIGNNCIGVDSLAVYMDSTITRTSTDQWRIYDNIGDSLTWNLTNTRFIRAYETDDNFILPSTASDTALVTLPNAGKGWRFSFFNFNATHTLQVDPQATDSINTNAAGKYAEMHPGASMTIECFSNNKWTVTSTSWTSSTAADSISFQP